MCHKGQKLLNKTASKLRSNEYFLFGYMATSFEDMRKFVKKEKLHYTKKMADKARLRGKW